MASPYSSTSYAEDFPYRETSIGGPFNRGHLNRAGELQPHPHTSDCFQSIWCYGEDARQYLSTHTTAQGRPTIKGYAGAVWASEMVWDFDHKADPNAALKDGRKLVGTLVEHGIPREAIAVYFSGSKGVHVAVDTGWFGGFDPARNLPQRFKRLARALAEGLPTLDRSICSGARLFRIVNTRHGKTGLFKVRITVDELRTLTLDGIKALASSPRQMPPWAGTPEPIPALVELWDQTEGPEDDARDAEPGTEGTCELAEDEVQGIAAKLRDYYLPMQRHDVATYAGGMLAKLGVTEASALRVIEALFDPADEDTDRQENSRQAVRDSYQLLRQDRNRVSGKYGLLELGIPETAVLDIETIIVIATTTRTAATGDPAASHTEAVSERLSVGDFYAILPQHKYLHRPTRELWEAAGVNGALPPIRVGDRDMPPSTWLDRHKPIHQLTWMPGAPEVIEDAVMREGGLHPHAGAKLYNQYLAPEAHAGDPDAAGTWLEHGQTLYPDDWTHCLAYFAHCVQQPGEKRNHALVFGGMPGIGKDALLEAVVHAVGSWNVGEVSPATLGERFNPYLRNVILRISEARDLGEVDRYALHERLKPIIAAPPATLRIDAKYIGEYRIPNIVGVIFTTNHRTGALYLPPDDRRHYVAWSEALAEDFPAGYFDRLFRWYQDGGFEHVRAYLEQYDLSGFDPKAPPKKTEAFWAMVDAERSPEEGELADVIELLGSPEAVTLEMLIQKADLHKLYEVSTVLNDRKARRRIPHLLKAAGYRPVRNPYAQDGFWRIQKRRQAVYASDRLPMRDQIAAAQQLVEGDE